VSTSFHQPTSLCLVSLRNTPAPHSLAIQAKAGLYFIVSTAIRKSLRWRCPDHPRPPELPQMPTYHLKRADEVGHSTAGSSIGCVGVPVNAKTAHSIICRVCGAARCVVMGVTAWLCHSAEAGGFAVGPTRYAARKMHSCGCGSAARLGASPRVAENPDCAGKKPWPRVTQAGRATTWKRIMRTGTAVRSPSDNRNWSARPGPGPVHRLMPGAARIALGPWRVATIAANGYRLSRALRHLCSVSRQGSLHGELKGLRRHGV